MKGQFTFWILLCQSLFGLLPNLYSTWVGTEDFYFSFLNESRWNNPVQQVGEGVLEPSGEKLIFTTSDEGHQTTILPWKENLPKSESWYVEALLSVPGTHESGDLSTAGIFFCLNDLPTYNGDGFRIRLENTQLTGSVTRRLIFEESIGEEVYSYYDQSMTVQDSFVRVKLQYLHTANMLIFCYESSPDSWLCVAADRAKFTLEEEDSFRVAILASVNLSDEMEGKVWVDDFFVYVDEQDKDFDGISAGREAQLGTSPTRADSDYDGLTDSQEIDSYGTDPLKADSDGDSLPDGLEVTAGGDPNQKTVLPTLLEPVGSPSADTRFLQIQTFPGLNYQVQLSTDLKYWSNHGNMIIGTGAKRELDLGTPQNPNAFYRLQVSD